MNMDEMNGIKQMCENLGLKLATAFPEGDDLFFVDYVDPKNYQQATHIKNLYLLMAMKRVMYSIRIAQSDLKGVQRLVFMKHE